MRYRLFLDGIDVSSYVISVKSSLKFQTNRFIGNAPSECFKIELNNKGLYFNDKLKGVFTLYKGDTLYKTLKVYEQPEKVFSDLSLTLYDRMVETNIRYNTDVNTYPKTIKAQLDEMSVLTGLIIDYSSLPSYVLGKVINFYDNTQLIRTYLRWLAELGSCNVFSLEDGSLKFIPFNKNTLTELIENRYIYEFETEEVYVCSGVFMEYLNLSAGTDDNHIYRLTKDNPYISAQEDLDNILSNIQGFTFTSVKNLKMRFLDGLFLGNKANYKEYFSVVPFSMEITYHAGDLSHDTCIISGQYSSEAEEEYTNYPNLKDRIKRVEINVDQNEQQLNIIAQDISDESERITDLELGLDGVKTSVSNSATKEELETVQKTLVEQTDEKWSATVTQIEELDAETQKARQVSQLMELTLRGLEIRGYDSESEIVSRIKTLMSNDRFAILYDDEEVMQIFRDIMKIFSINVQSAIIHGPIIQEVYGLGDEGGITEKWRGFE